MPRHLGVNDGKTTKGSQELLSLLVEILVDHQMHSFEPAPMQYGSLILNVYVDASFAAGGGGLAMYLVNPVNGKESIIKWASRRQTSMATSAPEAEVSAMAEGFGPSSIMSMKTDSAVALKQLGTQTVTVRTRTAAQKLHYLRELIYDDPQVEPIYISGDSQRADGLTKILSGRALVNCQGSLNHAYSSSQTEERQDKEKLEKQIEKEVHAAQAHVETARTGACVVDRQSGAESCSLDSLHDMRGDNSAVSASSCLACQEGQAQGQRNCSSTDEGTSTYRGASRRVVQLLQHQKS